MSESSKHRSQVLEYTKGNGCDLGSAGDPIVPWAITVDLPEKEYHIYNQERAAAPINWRGTALDLPFKDGVMDFVHHAHLIEDFADWGPLLRECDRVLKKNGYMIVAGPSHVRFRAAVRAGQGDNFSHKKELGEKELTAHLTAMNYDVLFERFANDSPLEYSVVCVARKK